MFQKPRMAQEIEIPGITKAASGPIIQSSPKAKGLVEGLGRGHNMYDGIRTQTTTIKDRVANRGKEEVWGRGTRAHDISFKKSKM